LFVSSFNSEARSIGEDIVMNRKEKSRSYGIGGIGDVLEMHQMQIFIIILIFLDTVASFSIFILKNDDTIVPASISNTFQSMLGWVTSVSSSLLCLEILAIFISFKAKVLTHLGYLLDSFICLIQIILYKNIGIYSTLLNFLRLWRLIRLISSMVDIEHNLQLECTRQLEEREVKLLHLQDEIRLLQDDIQKDKLTRTSLEAALMRYKEEVETLNEALTIAAEDIAEVAQAEDDYAEYEYEEEREREREEEERDNEQEENVEDMQYSKDSHAESTLIDERKESKGHNNRLHMLPSEEEEEEEEEEELFRDALSSVSNEHTIGLSGRRKQLYQQARKDVKEQERLKGAMSSRDKNTIVVQSDGTFKTS